jgi:hypothetical protein
MQKLLMYILLTLAKPAIGQNSFWTHKIDTFTLRGIEFTKPILYKHGSVQFLIEFDTLRNAIINNIDYYKEILHPEGGNTRLDRKSIKRSIKKLQLVSKRLEEQKTHSDTVTVSEIILKDNHHPKNMIKWTIARELDSGRCMVINETNKWQHLIIRDKGPWSTMRGGRKYSFPEHSNFFLDIMEWER